MNEKQYLLLLDIDVRKRHYHILDHGKIIKFVVQLEIKIGNKWKEVIRYDCAHNFTHKDCFNIKGECRKVKLNLNYEDALSFADDDINDNWELYKKNFIKGLI